MNDKKIAVLYTGAHPVHKKFGDSIKAEPLFIADRITKEQNLISKGFKLIKNVLSLPENFDFMLTESCYYYPAFKRKLRGLKKTKIINLSCGPTFYHLLTGRIRGVEKTILLDLVKEIDGHLVLGKYGEETVRMIDREKPLRVVYPFISDKAYNRLMCIKPNLDSKNVAIIVTNDYKYKGLDVAIDAIKMACSEDGEIKLSVIGNVDERIVNSLSKKHRAVRYLGFVPDIAKVLGENALYLHPARGDTFPISVIEAMVAGLPSLVSREVGAREVVERVADAFVVKRDPRIISKRILDYFDMPLKDKRDLSEKSRKEASLYTEKKMLKLFKDEFDSLTKEL